MFYGSPVPRDLAAKPFVEVSDPPFLPPPETPVDCKVIKFPVKPLRTYD